MIPVSKGQKALSCLHDKAFEYHNFNSLITIFDLRLFYTARRILKEKLDRKPITLAAWKQEYDRLQAEYAKLSPQYKPLREDLMKMRRVQYCVDRVLQRRQPEQEAPKKKQDIEL